MISFLLEIVPLQFNCNKYVPAVNDEGKFNVIFLSPAFCCSSINLRAIEPVIE